jgi:hypothetical protein
VRSANQDRTNEIIPPLKGDEAVRERFGDKPLTTDKGGGDEGYVG